MTKRKEYGPFDIDYRVRCVKPNGHFDRIYYGHTASEYDGPGADKVYDLTDDFRDKLGEGRTRFNGEERQEKHYFTKDLKRDEVIDALYRNPASGGVPGRADAVCVGARDAVGGTKGDGQAASGRRRSGVRAGVARTYTYEEETCPEHVASPDDPKVCDRCGTHIDSLRPDDEEY
jgi:hypothetical protein